MTRAAVGAAPRGPERGSQRRGMSQGKSRVMYDVVVVGAGIAGLTAARDLAAAGRAVLVLEGSPRIGGKLRVESVAGVRVDVGAEAMLNHRPEGVALARE